MTAIPIPTQAIAEFCRRNHVRKLALFGSVLTGSTGKKAGHDPNGAANERWS